MRSSPVIGAVLMIGAGVLGLQRGVGGKPQVQAPQAVLAPAVVAKNAEGSQRAQAPAPPAATRIVRMNPAKSTSVLRGVKVTAYCCCRVCCEAFSGGGRTSIGKNANIFDGVAADPKLLPYHTKLDIPGIGIREVDDTGGAMRQDAKRGIVHIDVRMASHQEARKFGVRWLDIVVLK